LYNHKSNATKEGYFSANPDALAEQHVLYAEMHNEEHMDRVERGVHAKFQSKNIPSVTMDEQPMKHRTVNKCSDAFPKGDLKVAFWLNASATYGEQTRLRCVSDTVSDGGKPLYVSVKEILHGFFPRLVQVREYPVYFTQGYLSVTQYL
jgi:hypothetical protein